MALMVITFSGTKVGFDYNPFAEKMATINAKWALASTWFCETDRNATELMNDIAPLLPPDEAFSIFSLPKNADFAIVRASEPSRHVISTFRNRKVLVFKKKLEVEVG